MYCILVIFLNPAIFFSYHIKMKCFSFYAFKESISSWTIKYMRRNKTNTNVYVSTILALLLKMLKIAQLQMLTANGRATNNDS